MSPNKHIETAQLQAEIEKYIGLGHNSVLFEFDDKDGKTSLHLITVNPRHNQSFLFHMTEGLDKASALKSMLEYIQQHKSMESSYTVQWSLMGEKTLHTSYFSAKNVMGALDKLFYDRDPNTISIFSVIMNPMT